MFKVWQGHIYIVIWCSHPLYHYYQILSTTEIKFQGFSMIVMRSSLVHLYDAFATELSQVQIATE